MQTKTTRWTAAAAAEEDEAEVKDEQPNHKKQEENEEEGVSTGEIKPLDVDVALTENQRDSGSNGMWLRLERYSA